MSGTTYLCEYVKDDVVVVEEKGSNESLPAAGREGYRDVKKNGKSKRLVVQPIL